MESLFDSHCSDLKSARLAVDGVAKELGVSFNIRKHERNKAGFHHSTVLSCSKGRKYVPYSRDDTTKPKQRESSTCKTDCPFSIRLTVPSDLRGPHLGGQIAKLGGLIEEPFIYLGTYVPTYLMTTRSKSWRLHDYSRHVTTR